MTTAGVAGETVLEWAYGRAAVEPEERPMQVDALFDLASLTKPLATTALVLRLVGEGAVSLDDPVDALAPDLAELGRHGVTPRRLLTHTAGLPAWLPLYCSARSRVEVRRELARVRPEAAVGERVVYSDLGFLLLGLLVEEIAGAPLDELFAAHVAAPLGLATAGFRPALPPERFAATERGNEFERTLVAQRGLEFAGFRTACYPGETNDGNAHYALGGVAGHAGLFATASEVAAIGEAWLERRILPPALVAAALTEQTPGLPERRGLGWQLASGRPPEPATPLDGSPPRLLPHSHGELLSASAFGHTGFTGTSLWIDPERRLVAALLTNAIHPRVGGSRVASIRARFHNALAAGLT